MPRIIDQNRLALLMHGAVASPFGKMGFGLLRYGAAPTVAVIDREAVGQELQALTGIPSKAPIVGTVREALQHGPDVLVLAVATPGGVMPEEWWPEVRQAVAAGLSLVNGLHRPLASHPDLTPLLRPGQWIWDIRQEPPGLDCGMGRARELPALRVLLVGTDMACGKMTAALELHREARRRGVRSQFLATGQIGVAIAGEGIALDAVRLDFATGAVEQLVLRHGLGHELLWIEGQGSLLHPASTGTYTLMRGALPTHLILAHRAGQESIARAPWVRIPPLSDVIALHEAVARAAGALPPARVAGIALNTGRLSDADARAAVDQTAAETGLPVSDVLRFGAAPLVDSVLGNAR